MLFKQITKDILGINNIRRLKLIIGASNILRFYRMLEFMHHPEYKKIIATNSDLKNKHKGQRCFIVGNGPSLKYLDFSLLADEFTFTVNQLPRNPNFSKIKTNYHLWSDSRFFELQKDRSEDLELLNVMHRVGAANNNPTVFYPIEFKGKIDNLGLSNKINTRYFFRRGVNHRQVLNSLVDFSDIVTDFSTVMQIAICLAVYMGFSKIYLLGCDCTGFISTAQAKLNNAKEAEYAYKISDNEKKRMERISEQVSIRDELLWYADIFDTYELLHTYCQKHGTELYNATFGGLLECLPRVQLEDVLGLKS